MPVAVQKRIQEGLENEELTKHGYRMSMGEASRHRALAKAVEEDGGLTVLRRLNLLFVWNKDRNPRLAKVARQDGNWVKNEYYHTSKW